MDFAFDHFAEICCYANVAAQATRILWQHDPASIMQIASLASNGVAGHIGHIAGKAVAVAALGLTGSWMVVLAPMAAGFTGSVIAKNLARRLRYHWLCRREVDALDHAVRRHCLASRDVIDASIRTANTVMIRFRALRANSAEPIQDCIEDWLDRGKQVQDYRQGTRGSLPSRGQRPIHPGSARRRPDCCRSGEPFARRPRRTASSKRRADRE